MFNYNEEMFKVLEILLKVLNPGEMIIKSVNISLNQYKLIELYNRLPTHVTIVPKVNEQTGCVVKSKI